MQDENTSRKRAVAAARIAHAAWSGGPHGAAAATANSIESATTRTEADTIKCHI